jgi:hypothetical protein
MGEITATASPDSKWVYTNDQGGVLAALLINTTIDEVAYTPAEEDAFINSVEDEIEHVLVKADDSVHVLELEPKRDDDQMIVRIFVEESDSERAAVILVLLRLGKLSESLVSYPVAHIAAQIQLGATLQQQREAAITLPPAYLASRLPGAVSGAFSAALSASPPSIVPTPIIMLAMALLAHTIGTSVQL